jgi:hypothetical protein
MNFSRFVGLFVFFAIPTALAQTNPVPFVNQPLVPTTVAPGGASFTLTVNGTGFVSGSSINWNGTPLSTTFITSSQLTATVPAANIAKASTASITVSNPSPGGGSSNVVFFAVSSPTNLEFTSFPNTNVGAPLSGPIVADFNRDGKLDFIVSATHQSNEQPTPYVFLGNGDGTFQPPKPINLVPLEEIAVGDFNGDGIPDLAGTYYDQGSFTDFVLVLLGNGDGTFSASFSYTLGPFGLLLGDFNGDGKLDILADNAAGVYVFLGNGDGTFQNPVISNIDNLELVGALGDFNGDGKLDFIGIEGSQLGWFEGNGDGTFQTPSTFYPVGANSDAVFAADLNGDGKLDLITVQSSTNGTYTVMLGNGDGTFQSGAVYSLGFPLVDELAVGDFDADGKLDLVLAGGNNGSAGTLVLPGNGDGTFQNPILLPITDTFAIGEAGDFNNDGKLDLIALNPVGALVTLLQDVPLPGLSPSSLSFADQAVSTTSSPQNVILTNNGTGPLSISSITITGANSQDFSQTNNCRASLSAGANCQIGVTFTPTALGARSASLAITDNALGSPQSVPLSGTGAQPVVQFSPSSVNFGAQTVGGTTSPQVVTLYNAGGSTLTITSIGITGANAGDFANTSGCGATLGSGASCQIKVTFTPTASGSRSAVLSVSDNAPRSPQAVALSGTGQDFSLAPSGSASATVAPGQTATYTVVVTPGGGFNQTVDLSCSGAPAQSTCTVSSSVTLDGVNPSMATVSVVTNASAMGLTQPVNAPPVGGAFSLWLEVSGILGLCVLATLHGRGRVRGRQVVCGVTLVYLLSIGITMSACGGGGGSSGGGGTQAGTYTLTVTGTSSAAKLTNKTNLTLVVQ